MLHDAPTYEIRESILPAKKWSLNSEGKWRVEEKAEATDRPYAPNYQQFPVYSRESELLHYSDAEYQEHFTSSRWSRGETDLLWNVCAQFNLNFPIVHDRFNWEMKQRSKSSYEECKGLEEIKERYFSITASLQSIRKYPGSRFIYDKDLDCRRRVFLGNHHSRNTEQSLEESFVIDYLTKLQMNGELSSRLASRIETIRILAGEQFTAGWPTLPELLKIAAGKGVSRLIDKSKKKKKKRPSSSNANSSAQKTSTASPNPSGTKKQASAAASVPKGSSAAGPAKKVKAAASSAIAAISNANIYLRSAKLHPLRVGSARAVEKILADFNLPLKPDLPTAAVVEKFDQIRSAIIRLIDLKKNTGLPPSKSLESSGSNSNL